jgi:hypothetical protein
MVFCDPRPSPFPSLPLASRGPLLRSGCRITRSPGLFLSLHAKHACTHSHPHIHAYSRRQNVDRAHKVFHLDTIIPMEAHAAKVPAAQGTANFMRIVNHWFEISNVKNSTKGIHLRLDGAQAWAPSNVQERVDYMLAVDDFVSRWAPGVSADVQSGRKVRWGLSHDTAWAWRQHSRAMVSICSALVFTLFIHSPPPSPFPLFLLFLLLVRSLSLFCFHCSLLSPCS